MKLAIDLIMYLLLGSLTAWFFYYYLRRALLGGFTAGMIVGAIGAILGPFLFTKIFLVVIEALQNGFFISNVDVLAALVGSYLTVYIYNKINHDRRRD